MSRNDELGLTNEAVGGINVEEVNTRTERDFFPLLLTCWQEDKKTDSRARLGQILLMQATAMAAMPSSRPTKPRRSLVVALTPT